MGVELELPSESDFERGEELARGKPVWPREGSVFIVGDFGVVVAGKVGAFGRELRTEEHYCCKVG